VKDWIPLLQSLVWPVFLALFLLAVRQMKQKVACTSQILKCFGPPSDQSVMRSPAFTTFSSNIRLQTA
jgi:hypothetical protein